MSETLPFTKVEGCGNDFVLIDQSQFDSVHRGRFSAVVAADFARFVCDRRRGVGSDGVLVLDRAQSGWQAIILNADGTHGGMCGNGLRCIALYLRQCGFLDSTGSCSVEMGGRITKIKMETDQPFRCSLDLGQVTVGSIDGQKLVDAHLLAEISAACDAECIGVAWVGNPHAAILVGQSDQADLERIASAVRGTGLFPQGVNVTLAQKGPGRVLHALTDERGVGPTPACASGAAALVAIAHEVSLIGAECEVRMPGGELVVSLSVDAERPSTWLARLSGGASIVFSGEISISAPYSES